MTAPEPPEVPADELAAAEEWVRKWVNTPGWYRQNTHVARLLREYDRRGAELHAREFAASYQAATIGRLRRDRDKLQVDLARALPVVEAAGAVVADWSDSDLDDNSDHPLWNRLDALARSVRS